MLNLIVALPCEAKPLIAHFKLSAVHHRTAYRMYESESLRLVISGVGKLACAAATSYLAAQHHDVMRDAWLNLGIAGHRDLNIGQAVLASKITDAGSSHNWYPMWPDKSMLPRRPLITVDQAQTDYPDDSLYDMEAAGFFAALMPHTTIELCPCIKVVSDNVHIPVHKFSQAYVSELIQTTLPAIDTCIAQLESLTHNVQLPVDVQPLQDELTRHWHFSVTRQHQLHRLLQRWQILCPQHPLTLATLQRCRSAQEVLNHLQQHLAGIVPDLITADNP